MVLGDPPGCGFVSAVGQSHGRPQISWIIRNHHCSFDFSYISSHIFPYLPIFSHIFPYFPIFFHIFPYFSISSHMFPYFPIVFPYFSIFLVIRMSFLGTPTNDPGTRLPSGTSSLPGTNGPTAVDNDE